MVTFSDLGLNKQLVSATEALGYTEPTPIQEKAIPLLLNGHDFLGIAPTGTGKTAAFVLPILRKLNYAQGNDPRCLILVPTRELAIQVYENAVELAQFTDLRIVKLYGGLGMKGQLEELEQGADIIVATPGRFYDIYMKGALNLKHVNTMVLDEADKMMDMGFMPQLNSILEILPTKKQNLLFSATFHPKVEQLTEDFLKFPQKVEVKQESKVVDTIDQYLYKVPNLKTKLNLLLHLLQDEELFNRVLVFSRTRETAENIFRFLSRKNVGEWRAIHANKGQNTRINAYNDFKDGKIRGVVATDVAARGIDVKEVSHVINFDVPVMYTDYVHRVGRTGRAQKEGVAISLATDVEMHHIKKIEELIENSITLLDLPEDLEVVETTQEEKQAFARESDRIKRKEDPTYQGAFHEKKNKKKGGVDRRAIKAYKFITEGAKKKGKKGGRKRRR